MMTMATDNNDDKDDDDDGNIHKNNHLRRQLLFHDDEEETTIMRRHCALWNPHIGLYGAWDTQVLLVFLVLALVLVYRPLGGLRHPSWLPTVSAPR